MDQTTPAPAPLQFDSAEPVATADPQGRTVTCAGCAATLHDSYHTANGKLVCTGCRAELEAAKPSGGFLLALLYGTGAAAAGWAVYFAILKLAEMELGLIAILVGYVVGVAVSRGSGGRGGWLYQGMAVGLTYLAIVCTYVPLMMPELQRQSPEVPAAVVGLTAFLLSLAYPFLAVTESPIGLVILAVGVYQAWKLNQRRTLTVAGPYSVAVPGQPVAG
ncbi:MAG TPA: hypothetical protein VF263_11215 [Longimicrobiaceae bacterium]